MILQEWSKTAKFNDRTLFTILYSQSIMSTPQISTLTYEIDWFGPFWGCLVVGLGRCGKNRPFHCFELLPPKKNAEFHVSFVEGHVVRPILTGGIGRPAINGHGMTPTQTTFHHSIIFQTHRIHGTGIFTLHLVGFWNGGSFIHLGSIPPSF